MALEGATVICADVDGAAAEEQATRINASGGHAHPMQIDVMDHEAAVNSINDGARLCGPYDILVYSAGATATADCLNHTLADWRRVLDVNLTGAFISAQAVARIMVDAHKRGSIILITSQLAHAAVKMKSAYLASKGGLRSLTLGMALDLAPVGIRVNAVAPGPVMTGFTRERFSDPDLLNWTLGRIPAGRLGRPEDISGAVAFLASDDSEWVTGTSLVVDGGYLAE
jgi:glucose 1-dehydrogenase